MNKGIGYNTDFLNSKLVRSGVTKVGGFGHDGIMDMLNRRFDEIDFQSAISDVIPFLRSDHTQAVKIWCPEMFRRLSERLRRS